jgi:hypothetical protein
MPLFDAEKRKQPQAKQNPNPSTKNKPNQTLQKSKGIGMKKHGDAKKPALNR